MLVGALRHVRPSERFSKSRGLSASVSLLSSPTPLCSFTCAIFRALLDSCSSFFAPKPHRNACYAGYPVPLLLTHPIFSSLREFQHGAFSRKHSRARRKLLHCRLSTQSNAWRSILKFSLRRPDMILAHNKKTQYAWISSEKEMNKLRILP